jgi:hypothetical protein
MARILSENRGVVQIETWDKRDAVIAALAAHGYRLTGGGAARSALREAVCLIEREF